MSNFRHRLEVLDRAHRWWPQLTAAQLGEAAELIWRWASETEETPPPPERRANRERNANIVAAWTPRRRAEQAERAKALWARRKSQPAPGPDDPKPAADIDPPAKPPAPDAPSAAGALAENSGAAVARSENSGKPMAATPPGGRDRQPLPWVGRAAVAKAAASQSAPPEPWALARRALRKAGWEVKQFDGDLLLDGQHTSDEELIALARKEGLL